MAKIFDIEKGAPMDVYIYSKKEHPPAHCHVFYEGEEAVVFLDPVEVRKTSPNLNDWEIERVLKYIEDQQTFLIDQWITITGLPLV